MEQAEKKRRLRSIRIGTLIAVAAIMLAVILTLLYAPPEGDSDNVTGDVEATPTLGITNLAQTLEVNRTFQYKDIDITLSQAMIATKFSDDRTRAGTYTVRVMVKTKNKSQNLVGIEYASLAQLVLPDGKVIASKRVSVNPEEMPNGGQTGFFDFPVAEKVPLSSLALRFGTTTVPLGKG